ncbi:SLBB domain-containing protein [Geofilum sp. OHC36d9]|uniref:SLBB domain-containing protein n=1 Tax=Geofilum sp. OHC36d9 TaxID=3458413 RepID=UPI0040341E74
MSEVKVSFFLRWLIVLVSCVFLLSEVGLMAQSSSFNTSDLSTVRSSQISDTQLKSFIERGKAEGLTAEEALDLAQQRGLSPSEASTLMQRVRALEAEDPVQTASPSVLRQEVDIPLFVPDTMEEQKTEAGPVIFGSQLFSGGNLTFEPSLNIPTPVNYVLGAGDQIVIDIWGASTNLYQLEVGPEGTVVIDNVGPLYVNGLTIEEAEKRILDKLKQLYRGLRPGEAGQDTYARVSLGRVRTIQVTVLGEVERPGNYTVSSLTTIFNALYQAGGLNKVGSYRTVEVIRNNKRVASLDIYDFLLYGDQKDNIRLNDQDVIKVGVYTNRVEVRGEVKRPGLYEITPEETLADLIDFAGSYTDSAYTRQLKVVRNTDMERRIERVKRDGYDSYPLQNGDVITIEPLLNRFENRVAIEGAVWRPGDYELTDGMTLLQLIKKAEGLKPEAFKSRGLIYRLTDTNDFSVEAFNLNDIIDGVSQDIVLSSEDRIVIKTIFEMREELTVQIQGEVQSGGDLPYRENMTLGDLILAANGFKSSASEARIEVYRRIIGEPAPEQRSTQMADSYLFSVSRDLVLDGEAKNFVLKPYDQVYVRKRPDYQVQRSVRIEGEVMYPGIYVLRNRHERISDLVARAGGLTGEAFVEGATLERHAKRPDKSQMLLDGMPDEVINLEQSGVNNVGINLVDILDKPGSREDLQLREGDVVKVPQRLQTVMTDGAVLNSTEIRYIQGKNFKYYVSRSGGYSENAIKRKVYVIHPNGDIATRKNFLFFHSNPKITAGSEVIIPQKIQQEPLSSGERITILSSIVSMAAVVVTAMSRF